jgi:hypothetical protein
MFKAFKDTNTGEVYDWVKINEDGTSISVNVPAHLWKKEKDWTEEEIEALFSGSNVAPIEVAPVEVPTNEAAPEDPSFL